MHFPLVPPPFDSHDKPPALKVPKQFRDLCSRVERNDGFTYYDVGQWLARNMLNDMPAHISEYEFGDCLGYVTEQVFEGNKAAVLRWYEIHYPLHLDLIPRRNRREFVRGVLMAFYEDNRDDPEVAPAATADAP